MTQFLQTLPKIENYEDIGLKSFLIFIILVCFFVIHQLWKDKKHIISQHTDRVDKVQDDHKEDLKNFDSERSKTVNELMQVLNKISFNIEKNDGSQKDFKESINRLIILAEQIKTKINE